MTDEGQRARDPHPPPWHDMAAGAILVGLGAHWIQFAEVMGTVLIAVGVFQIVMVYILRRRAALNLPPLWWGTLNRAFRRGAILALGILVFVWFAAVVFGVWVIENMP